MNRLIIIVSLIIALLILPTANAQSKYTTTPEGLMDKMTGHWVMTGTIRRSQTTHDVDVDWILKREYIRIHEVSREKDEKGGPSYEAWIYLVWDAKNNEYAVMWLDNTAATNFAPEGVGHAKPDGDRIPFIFKDPDGGGIHTTFAYAPQNDTWSWTIDNIDKSGKSSPFARLSLTRK